MQIQSNVYVGIKPSLQQQRSLGLDSSHKGTSGELVNNSATTGIDSIFDSCDYVLLAITNNRYQDRVNKYVERYAHHADPFEELAIPEPHLQDMLISPFNNSGTENGDPNAVTTKTNSPAYIGLLASWIDLENHDLIKREMSLQVLLNECKLAKYIGITQVILAPPRDISNLKLYAQMVARLLSHELFNNDSSPMLLSISLPLYEDSDALATWALWNTVRRLCNYHPALMVSLAFPRTKVPEYVIVRWLTEPVSCLLLSSSIFVTNQYDYPVLHKFNQTLIQRFQAINGNSQIKSNSLVIIMHGVEKYRDIVQGGEVGYLEYINFLLKKNDKLALSANNKHPQHQSPQLMVPLTPHSDNLSNEVYSVFERDTVKYEMYGKAIRAALMDLMNMQKHSATGKLVVLVAGAGRGPLVTQTFNAARELKLGSRLRIMALEKNPQAFLYLQKLNFDQWNNSVTLLQEDMRKWKSSDKADLCISELLGSFGCNELSPECLWNIQQHHSSAHTIFIPQSYTSYVAPVTSPLLYQKLSLESRKIQPTSTSYLEQPWVMHCLPHSILSTRVNEMWTFTHPAPPHSNVHEIFNKSVTTEFKIKHRGEIHGLAGYFTTHLYAEYTLSILPEDMYVEGPTGLAERRAPTPGLHSWSPFIMPLEQPLMVTDDTEISVMCSRNMDPHRVWYEWAVESYVYLEVSRQAPATASTDVDTEMREDTAHSAATDHTRRREFTSAIAAESTGFLPGFENGWQSVHDIHEQADAPAAIPDPVPELDVHVRVNTGVSQLHNCDGAHFSIPL